MAEDVKIVKDGLGALIEIKALIDKATPGKISKAGDPQAQCDLGFRFDKGDGVKKDEYNAYTWFKLAAEQGYAVAQRQLGFRYEKGLDGTPKDFAKAIEWYEKAAAAGMMRWGDAEAQDRLGNIYFKGLMGKNQDTKTALSWYMLAAKQDHISAQYNVAQCYIRFASDLNFFANGKDKQKFKREQGQQVVEWFKRASEPGKAKKDLSGIIAQIELGWIFENAFYEQKEDLDKAIELYRSSAELEIGYHYARIMAIGKGIRQNKREACEWLLKTLKDNRMFYLEASKLLYELMTENPNLMSESKEQSEYQCYVGIYCATKVSEYHNENEKGRKNDNTQEIRRFSQEACRWFTKASILTPHGMAMFGWLLEKVTGGQQNVKFGQLLQEYGAKAGSLWGMYFFSAVQLQRGNKRDAYKWLVRSVSGEEGFKGKKGEVDKLLAEDPSLREVVIEPLVIVPIVERSHLALLPLEHKAKAEAQASPGAAPASPALGLQEHKDDQDVPILFILKQMSQKITVLRESAKEIPKLIGESKEQERSLKDMTSGLQAIECTAVGLRADLRGSQQELKALRESVDALQNKSLASGGPGVAGVHYQFSSLQSLSQPQPQPQPQPQLQMQAQALIALYVEEELQIEGHEEGKSNKGNKPNKES